MKKFSKISTRTISSLKFLKNQTKKNAGALMGAKFQQKKKYNTYEKSSKNNQHFWALAAAASLTTVGVTQWYKNEKKNGKKILLDSKKNPQPTVISGMHPQCAIVVIHLKNRKYFADVVKNYSGKLQEVVKQVSPPKVKSSGDDDDDEDEDEFDLPAVMAGIGFDTKEWVNFSKGENLNLPDGIGEYRKRSGKWGKMPSTGGEIVIHVKAATKSLCYETVDGFLKTLPKNYIKKVEDNYGWQYRDGRDLSGFLDGTENTVGNEERSSAGLNSTGGSFLIHQVWKHDLDYLNSKPVSEQEGWIGRKKDWSAELGSDVMPKTSHVSRMRDSEFKKIPIVRQSMPFGNIGDKNGLLFIAYSSDVKKFDIMLDRMTGNHASKDGHYNDAVMKYSKCKTGNYFYFPSQDELNNLK